MKLSIFVCILSSFDCKPFPQSNTILDVVCPDSEDGFAVFVPHPTDCSLYYMCVGGSPILMPCPPGLYFDPSLNVCNYPEYVDCLNQESKTSGPVESTTTTSVQESITVDSS